MLLILCLFLVSAGAIYLACEYFVNGIEWLGRKHDEPKAVEAAKLMERAIEKVIAERKTLTPDLGGKASTSQMGDAIAAAV